MSRKLFQLTPECESIEVTNSPQTQIRPESKSCSQIEMQNLKVSSNIENTTWKSL
jgi:hypothetical protein